MKKGRREAERRHNKEGVFSSILTRYLACLPGSFGGSLGLVVVACAVFLGCILISVLLHEPIPRIHDEFSYLLMADTFAHGRITNPTPPFPEFFDTFHVLMRPVYVSKYFPAQGVFLAIGQKLTGHPAVGVWLSSALACAAAIWMLEAWSSASWALLGGVLMALQYGIFSYWSQSYWGGMVAALGGGLFFAAFRRVWTRFSWQNAIWLSLGLLILANSRPLEGALTIIPATILFVRQVLKDRRWKEAEFLPMFILPFLLVLTGGVLATGYYNRSTTGSSITPPYMLHEQQYQESPPFIFLSKRPKLEYSSTFIRYFYEVQENRLWASQRIPKLWMTAIASRLTTWWLFYCGYFLSLPLLLPSILRGGNLRWIQTGLIAAWLILSSKSGPQEFAITGLIDVLVLLQIVTLWFVFDSFWQRLALVTIAAVIVEGFFVKWAWSHYSAPAATLVLFLQVEGLRWIWNWRQSEQKAGAPNGHRPRSALREKPNRNGKIRTLRWIVCLVPIACLISLCWRIEASRQGWREEAQSPEQQALLMKDWSLRRASLEGWLGQQQSPQLVFVRYWPRHNVNFEWVYNHADIMSSHVIWARDLGAEHNNILLNVVPDRTVWLLTADAPDPRLVPYLAATKTPQQ